MAEERLTAEDRAELERLARAATPGPWRAYHRDVTVDNDSDADATCAGFLGWEVEGPEQPDRGMFVRAADAKFVVEARNSVAELCAEVERLKSDLAFAQSDLCRTLAEVERLKAALAELAFAIRQRDMLELHYSLDPHPAETYLALGEARGRLNVALAAAEGQPAPPTEGG